jgi:hypothetical protein
MLRASKQVAGSGARPGQRDVEPKLGEGALRLAALQGRSPLHHPGLDALLGGVHRLPAGAPLRRVEPADGTQQLRDGALASEVAGPGSVQGLEVLRRLDLGPRLVLELLEVVASRRHRRLA